MVNSLSNPQNKTTCPTFLDGHLSKSGKAQLRAAKVFKAAVTVAYDDMFDHPWKMIFYTIPFFGAGSVIMLATVGWHYLGHSKKSETYKSQIAGAFNDAVRYDLYRDCYYMDERGSVHVNSKDLSMHCAGWWYRHLSQKVREKVYDMDKSKCKAIMYKQLVKRLPRPNTV